MSGNMRELVNIWKTRRFRTDDISLSAACRSIGKPTQMFEAKKVSPAEWTLCRTGTNTPATFSYAAVFASSDPWETGNLVLKHEGDSEPDPVGDRAERFASFRCNYSYSFDTTGDPGLYSAQMDIDSYMETVPGFNDVDPKERRAWQSGNGGHNMQRFWIRSPMFLKMREGERRVPPPEYLHEWVKVADRRSRTWKANPARPNVLSLEDGRLKKIGDANPPDLVYGDAVAITFTLSYILGKHDWYPVYTLLDVVRVGSARAAGDRHDAGDLVVLDEPDRAALAEGEVVDDDGGPGVLASIAMNTDAAAARDGSRSRHNGSIALGDDVTMTAVAGSMDANALVQGTEDAFGVAEVAEDEMELDDSVPDTETQDAITLVDTEAVESGDSHGARSGSTDSDVSSVTAESVRSGNSGTGDGDVGDTDVVHAAVLEDRGVGLMKRRADASPPSVRRVKGRR